MSEFNNRKTTLNKHLFVMFLFSFVLFTTYYTKKTTLLILAATGLVVLTLIILLYIIAQKSENLYLTNIQYISLFTLLFFVPTFYSSRNIGDPVIYIMFFIFISLLLLIYHKAEILLIPFSLLCTLINRDFIFMLFNIIIYLLVYKILSSKTLKQRNIYILLGICCFISVLTLFIYLNAIDFQLLNIDLYVEANTAYHFYKYIELLIYCILMLPYIILGIRLFRNILNKTQNSLEKAKYILIPILALSIVPCYIREMHNGLLLFATTAYFTLVILTLCALNDELMLEQLHLLMEDIQQRYKYSFVLLLYIVTMIPFYDVNINISLQNIIYWLDTNFFHLL